MEERGDLPKKRRWFSQPFFCTWLSSHSASAADETPVNVLHTFKSHYCLSQGTAYPLKLPLVCIQLSYYSSIMGEKSIGDSFRRQHVAMFQERRSIYHSFLIALILMRHFYSAVNVPGTSQNRAKAEPLASNVMDKTQLRTAA